MNVPSAPGAPENIYQGGSHPMRPYEHDLAFLHEELEHHEYIAKKYTQEYDKDLAREFTKICGDIRLSIQAVEKKQEAAISEWSALTRSEREALLLPIYNAAEETVAKISDAGCPEFSRYLDNLFTDFLIDLVEFKE